MDNFSPEDLFLIRRTSLGWIPCSWSCARIYGQRRILASNFSQTTCASTGHCWDKYAPRWQWHWVATYEALWCCWAADYGLALHGNPGLSDPTLCGTGLGQHAPPFSLEMPTHIRHKLITKTKQQLNVYCSNYKDGLILTYPSLSCSRTRKPVILSLSACTEFHLFGMGTTTTPAAFPASWMWATVLRKACSTFPPSPFLKARP